MVPTSVSHIVRFRDLQGHGFELYQSLVGDLTTGTIDGARDAHGRILKFQERATILDGTIRAYEYSYDAAGRLQQVDRDGSPWLEASYDANGNRTSLTTPAGTEIGTYNERDQLVSYAGHSYTYDADGYLQSVLGASGGITTYDYDASGNLRAVALADGRNIHYEVDAQNRRIAKYVDGTLSHQLLYRGRTPIAKMNADGKITAVYVFTDNPRVPSHIILPDENGCLTFGESCAAEPFFVISDHLGSVRFVVEALTLEIVQRIDYDEFGRVLVDTNPGFQPFGFAGGLYDADTGLVRFGGRDYDAVTGRWTAKDPILFGGGDTNLYAYCRNDPMNCIDPSGLADIFIGVEGDLVGGPIGVESAFGIVIDTDHLLESGFFRTGGPAAGGNVGVSVCVGAVVRDIEGFGSDIDANIGKWSPSVIFDDQGVNGASLGIGPGVGVSVAQGYTTTSTVQDAINVARGWFN